MYVAYRANNIRGVNSTNPIDNLPSTPNHIVQYLRCPRDAMHYGTGCFMIVKSTVTPLAHNVSLYCPDVNNFLCNLQQFGIGNPSIKFNNSECHTTHCHSNNLYTCTSLEIPIHPSGMVYEPCPDMLYKCKDGTCIHHGYLDGEKDCPGGGDEKVTNFPCLMSKSLHRLDDRCHDFKCTSGEYILWHMVCDGQSDCAGHHDEKLCPVGYKNGRVAKQPEAQFICTQSRVAIPPSLLNDLVPDCPHGEDEQYYPNGFNLSLQLQLLTVCVTQGSLPCLLGHPRCFPFDKLCLYDLDINGKLRHCRNGGHLRKCAAIGCPGRFKCALSYCIPTRRVCNGAQDCPGGEDETKDVCSSVTDSCPAQFKCKNGDCIDLHELGDGHPDCGTTADDEQYCKCPTGCECKESVMICTKSTAHLTFEVTGFKFAKIASNIKHIPRFIGGLRLLHLSVSQADLTTIASNMFSDVPNLVVLKLTDNPYLHFIADLAFSGLSHLHTLQLLNSPKITTLSRQTFSKLSSLEVLSFSNSGVTKIASDLFPDLLSIKSIYLTNTSLVHINFTIKLHLKSIVLDIKNNRNLSTVLIERPESLALDEFNLYTDSAMVCCVYDSMLNCTGPEFTTHWCGTEYYYRQQVVCVTHSVITLILSSICIAMRVVQCIKDKLMNTLLIYTHTLGILTTGHVCMTAVKDTMFPHMLHVLENPKYMWCCAAGFVQLFSTCAMPLVAIGISYSYASGLEKGIVRSRLSIFICLFIITSLSVLMSAIWLYLLVNVEPYQLTDSCSFLCVSAGLQTQAGFVLALCLQQIVIWSYMLTLLQYHKASRVIKKSAMEVSSASGHRFGAKQGNVHRVFYHTSLISLVAGLCVVTYITLATVGVSFSHTLDMAISLHVLPLIYTLNDVLYLVRKLHNRAK